jgi:hypothetical protein
VLAALESSVSGSNNLIAVSTGASSLLNPISFAYDADDPANDSPLFANYITNDDGKKVPDLDAATGTVPLLAATSVAIGAGAGMCDDVYGSLLPATDQRGQVRANPNPTIGSYELPLTLYATSLTSSDLGETYVGTPVWYQYEIGTDEWNSSQVAYGKAEDCISDWNWGAAGWYEDVTEFNRKVHREMQFAEPGTYYILGAAKKHANEAYTYSYQSWANNGIFDYENGSTIEVLPLQNPAGISAAPGETSITLKATEWLNRRILIVRYPDGVEPAAPSGTSYSAGDEIGEGTVVYFAFGIGEPDTDADEATVTDNGLSSNTTYDYYFYSENYGYYSDGAKVSKTTSSVTSAKNVEVLKSLRVVGNQIIVDSEEESALAVYNGLGQLLINRTLVKGENRIAVNTPGIVIVKTANEAAKAVIR